MRGRRPGAACVGTGPAPRALGPAPRAPGPAPQPYGRPSRTRWPSTSRGRGTRGGSRTGLRDPTAACSRTPREGQVDSQTDVSPSLIAPVHSIQKNFIRRNYRNYRMENTKTLSPCSPRNLQSVLRLQPPVPPGVLPGLEPRSWGGMAGHPPDPWSSEQHEVYQTPVLGVSQPDPTTPLMLHLHPAVAQPWSSAPQ